MSSVTASPQKSNTAAIFTYFSPLTLLVYLVVPHGYLLDVSTSYMLKNQLHASALEVSSFRVITAIPLYFSVAFGLTRDLWSPFGLKDRGYFLIFAPITALVYFWMASSTLSYRELFVGMLLVMFTYRFVAAAYQGLLALIGQEKLMSGRLTAVWQIFGSVPYVIGGFASGWVTEHLKPQQTFFVVAVITLLIAAMALLKPRAVFEHAYDRVEARGAGFVADVKRLLRHRATYPAVLVLFLFQFSPGSNTPLQYYLTNHLHASDAIYGDYNAIFSAAFVPVFFLYGWLCKRVSLKSLLWWGTILTVPQMVPLAFIGSAGWALPIAAITGMLGGIAAAAYFDLAIRSCPPGLQGSLMMLIDCFFYLSYRGGDLVGAEIYQSSPQYGFLYCVIATTAVYALILPVLLLIPKELIATKDGERNKAVEAERLAEVEAAVAAQ
jgi:MFS family permease